MHILIQVSFLVTSFFKKEFLSCRRRKLYVKTRSLSIAMKSQLHIDIFHLRNYVIIYRLPENVNDIHYLLHIILRIFSKYSLKVFVITRRSYRRPVTATFIFQVKIFNSKSFKPIANGCNSCSTTSVNSINFVCIIICIITFCLLYTSDAADE